MIKNIVKTVNWTHDSNFDVWLSELVNITYREIIYLEKSVLDYLGIWPPHNFVLFLFIYFKNILGYHCCDLLI